MVRENLEQFVKKQAGAPILQIRIRRPKFSEERRGLRRMERYYRQVGECWKTYWETQLFPQAQAAAQAAKDQSLPFSPWQATLDFTVSYESEALVSIYLDAVQTQGVPSKLMVRTACTWDYSTGTPLPLSHFWPLGRRGRRKLIAALAVQAEELLHSGQSLLDEDCLEKLGPQFHAQRFYLSENRIHLFYPLYAIASYGEGIPDFSLSLPDSSSSR